MEYRDIFPSIYDLTQYLRQDYCGDDGSNTWKRYDTKRQSSLDNEEWNEEYGTLLENVLRAETLQGLEDSIRRLDSLVETLSGSVKPPESVKRVPQWGRSGIHLNLNRVLSGNLQQAWRRTVPASRPTQGRILTLVIPAAVSWDIDAEQIAWTNAASLALGALAERAGYQVSIWSVGAINAAYDNGTGTPDWLCAVCLKDAGALWSVQNVAVAIHGGYFRKLLFRVLESGTAQKRGRVGYGHGYAKRGSHLHQAVQQWAEQQGWTGVIYGATQDAHITHQDRAEVWIQTQIAQLEA